MRPERFHHDVVRHRGMEQKRTIACETSPYVFMARFEATPGICLILAVKAAQTPASLEGYDTWPLN